MITVGTFSKPEEANLLRCRLEAEGIPTFIRDEMTIQMDWMYSNALGGVRVEVPEEHAAAAREIINLPPVEEISEPARVCPRCQSPEVIAPEWPRKVAYLSMLLVSFPLLFSRRRFKCLKCEYTWR